MHSNNFPKNVQLPGLQSPDCADQKIGSSSSPITLNLFTVGFHFHHAQKASTFSLGSIPIPCKTRHSFKLLLSHIHQSLGGWTLDNPIPTPRAATKSKRMKITVHNADDVPVVTLNNLPD
uniref:Uncharacterized protein n=1 Tax=Nelumbo nucifera TaxID=4432 RepID=A0A822ZJ92_NELNU|nr:TPA_asm: hypothetical protein HUJ06_016111 [Nelumbo nucifera]